MRGEVLRLVHDEIHLAEGAAADIGEGRDEELLLLEHRLDLERLFGTRLEAALDDVQVVHQRLYVRAHLAPLVAGEEADVLAAEHHGRAAEDDLVEVLLLLQRGGQGDERLARAGAAGQGHERDGGIQAGVQGEALLVVAGTDAVGLLRPHEDDLLPMVVVAGTDGGAAQVELVQLVGFGLLLGDLLPGDAVVLPVGELLDDLGIRIHVHDLPFEVVEVFVVHAAGLVVLRGHADGLRLQAQVDVLGHQGDEPAGVLRPHPQGRGQDPVVLGVVLEQVGEFGGEGVVGFDLDVAEPLAEGDALGPELPLVGELVDVPHEGAGVEREGVVALLELVQFLDHGDGDHEVVLLEPLDRLVVVQDDVGVEDKYLGHGFGVVSLLPPGSSSGTPGCR